MFKTLGILFNKIMRHYDFYYHSNRTNLHLYIFQRTQNYLEYIMNIT